MLLTILLACNAPPTEAGAILTAPDAQRDGRLGADGAYGAARLTYEVLARATDVVHVQVIFPADADGWPDATALPAPPVLLIQGGSVAEDRYLWLAAHLATRGYAVVLPHHGRDLAFFEPDNAIYAWDRLADWSQEPGTLRGLIDPDADAVSLGHSLGAVVGAGLWAEEPRLAGVVMLAGYPSGGADVASRAGSPALAIAGETDGLSPPETIADNLTGIAPPLLFAIVDGMNHFAWTDEASERDLARDGALDGDLDTLRTAALGLLDPWLDATLKGDAEAAALLEAGQFTGVVIP